MNFTFDPDISWWIVFAQGIVSFFSPCVLPILPVFLGYLATSAKKPDQLDNNIYNIKKVCLHTLLFILGIGTAFFTLAFSNISFVEVLVENGAILYSISAVIMVLIGLYQFGIFDKFKSNKSKPVEAEQAKDIETEETDKTKFTPKNLCFLVSFALGFTFSFAWTPAFNSILANVTFLNTLENNASGAISRLFGYTLGLAVPFLILAVLVAKVLISANKKNDISKYLIKSGASLLVFMGLITLTGATTQMSTYFASVSDNSGIGLDEEYEKQQLITSVQSTETAILDAMTARDEQLAYEAELAELSAAAQADAESDMTPALNVSLYDQYGELRTLGEFSGQVVVLNFIGTWNENSEKQMETMQALYEQYGENEGDVAIVGVAAPNTNGEVDEDEVIEFLADKGITFPVLMDEGCYLYMYYEISSLPTMFLITEIGNVYGYVAGAYDSEVFEDLIQQALDIEY